MSLSDYTDDELKEELARRHPYVDMLGHDYSKDRTHGWEKVWKKDKVGCWTDPFTWQCRYCGIYKGAGAAPTQTECSPNNFFKWNEKDKWLGFP